MGQASGGVKITRVLPTSPAEKAGLRKGDVITMIDGIQVLSPAAVLRITTKASVGQVLRVIALRGKDAKHFRLEVVARPELAKLIRLYLVGTPAPDFELPLVNRRGRLKCSSLRGKVVLLYFWASWCDSCKLNMPRLKRLHRAYASKGLVIYSMGQDKRAETLKKTVAMLDLPFPVGHNPRNRVGLLYKSKNVPSVVVIDRKGIIRDYMQGSSHSYDRLERAVSPWLKSR